MSHEQSGDISRRSILAGTGAALGLLAAGGLLEACSSREAGPFASEPSWEQDFAAIRGGAIDERYWSISTGTTIPGFNKEAEALTANRDNLRVEGGVLVLEGLKQAHLVEGRRYTSARVISKHAFPLGKVEVDAQLPAGKGTWPGIWLLPPKGGMRGRYNPAHFGISPDGANAWAINGEIDICEASGQYPGVITSTVHSYDSVSSGHAPADFFAQKAVPSTTTAFNTYGVERTEDRITFTLNGKPYHTVTKDSDDPRRWPFDQAYNLILDLALGGTDGGPIEGAGPWQMGVKAARYYTLAS